MAYTSKYTGGQIEEKLDEIFASKLQEKAVEIVDNGATEVSADEGFLGLGKVSINVAIPTEEKVVDITENGTTEVVADNGFLSKVSVNVNVPTSGGDTTIVSPKDVNFRDYDGTILHSYTKDAFLALAEMPTLPTRQGLTCQGWNYNMEDAKAYVEEYGKLDIGATYITDDGKTRLYITIAAEGRMNVPLRLQQSVSDGVVIDWGDGSATETFNKTSATTLRHTYGKVGDYVITLEVTSGTLSLSGSSSYGIFADSMMVYGNMLQKVEIGNGVTSIGSLAFYNCYSLSSAVIPNSVTSIGENVFNSCYSLVSVVIPNSVTSMRGQAFYNCYSLSSVVIPNGVTSMGNSVFYNCYSLVSVVIPNSVTSMGGQAFRSCSSLSSVVIPNGVTIMGNSVFYNCYSLVSVVIPNSVTSIESGAFYSCSSIAFYDFSGHTSVPTLSNTQAFYSIALDCKIVVPDALYDEWIAATNWSSYASKIVKASEFNG